MTFGQGYLLARPGPAWPELDHDQEPDTFVTRDAQSKRKAEDRVRLRRDLNAATTAAAACEIVADHLFELGQMMPSLYLERHGQLRCVAQRGLWQVLDGLSHAAGHHRQDVGDERGDRRAERGGLARVPRSDPGCGGRDLRADRDR